jgi:hypothetical protein
LIYLDNEYEEDSKENISLDGENFILIIEKIDQLGIKMGQVCTEIENHTHSICRKFYVVPKLILNTQFVIRFRQTIKYWLRRVDTMLCVLYATQKAKKAIKVVHFVDV